MPREGGAEGEAYLGTGKLMTDNLAKRRQAAPVEDRRASKPEVNLPKITYSSQYPTLASDVTPKALRNY